VCFCCDFGIAEHCPHVVGMAAFEQTLGGSVGEILFAVIGHLHCHRQDCETLQLWLGSVVAKLAKHFDERLEPNSTPAALQASQFYTTKEGSKRRLDEHYTAALQSGVAGGRAGNSSMLARALGDMSSISANESDETHLQNYASAGQLEVAR
jgi:hypothetical protein